ncbi:MAG: hypothetical protein AB7F99_13130 [Vicinamibacterales bacterium]
MTRRTLTHGASVLLALCFVAPAPIRGQEQTQEAVPSQVATPAAHLTSESADDGKLARWIDVQNATLNLRYRFADNSEGVITTNQLQHRESLRARLKFDAPGRYSLNFGIFTGVRFTSGWDNTGLGANPAQKNLTFKALYVAAQPMRGLDVEAGGLYVIRGEATEVTTYDEDGYLMGQRISVRRPDVSYFDEVSFTNAYFTSDPTQISVRNRFRHIDEPNYRQVLVRKLLAERLSLSADLTIVDGATTWRQAARVNVNQVIDGVLFENYQRTTQPTAYGVAVTASKSINTHVSVNGGFASIDTASGGLNADRFNIGRRAFIMLTYSFSPEFLASAFVTTAVGRNEPLPQRTLTNIVFTYNAIPGLRRTGWF